MKRIFTAIRKFFFPPADSNLYVRVLPLAAVAVIVMVIFLAGNIAWEETNSPSFCGNACHTMPPEYATYQTSAHTNVTCEDCHMGRDRMSIMIVRKINYSWQTGSAMLFNTYTYPIVAKNMAPAREACENCHKPDKFSSDTLVQLKHYALDEANTETSVFVSLKTGGGLQRQGLGYGIHWHIENQVYYYATDAEQQIIPYVAVVGSNGTKTEYIDIETKFDPTTIKPGELKKMDCITCHNRTAHEFQSPQEIMDNLLSHGQVSATIPGINQKAIAVLSASYKTVNEALNAIDGLKTYYKQEKAQFYTANTALVDNAVQAIKDAYQSNYFPDQKVDWQTHPNNIGHVESPGCFRCHDGKHLNTAGAPVRLECNVCHSIPVVSGPTQLSASMQLEKGFEPDSHKAPNWIGLHNQVFNESCAGCHTTEDAGGVSNTSFCSNSVCHGSDWQFAGFDAPKLRASLMEQAKAFITPTPLPTPTSKPQESPDDGLGDAKAPTPTPTQAKSESPVTFSQVVQIFKDKCSSCHGASNAMKGLDLTSYSTTMKGSADGPVVVPFEPDNSALVKVQSGTTKHFGQLTAEELALVKQWIKSGALEK